MRQKGTKNNTILFWCTLNIREGNYRQNVDSLRKLQNFFSLQLHFTLAVVYKGFFFFNKKNACSFLLK